MLNKVINFYNQILFRLRFLLFYSLTIYPFPAGIALTAHSKHAAKRMLVYLHWKAHVPRRAHKV